jgi:tRNA threonylcarbamoyl adenosine modification protein YeaZ
MNILAMDTSGPVLSLALRSAGGTLCFHRELVRPHDETLLPQAKKLLVRAGLDWNGLHALAVASGPGRFTGIRIGMAFASVLAERLGIPALPVSRLEALAEMSDGRKICAVLPGYRDEMFYQLFNRNPAGRPKPAAPAVWADAEKWRIASREFTRQGISLAQADVRARDLIAIADRLMAERRPPRFEPLYLKPASYERSAGPAR